MNDRRIMNHMLLILFTILYPVIQSFAQISGISPQIEGWEISDRQFFNAEDLYMHINGAAPLYHGYGFKGLTVVEYQQENEETVLAEFYQHRSEIDAFGIYSQERPDSGRFLTTGAQGYIQFPFLNFTTGHLYVKLTADRSDPKYEGRLKMIAGKIADLLEQEHQIPELFRDFPENGRVPNSEKFTIRNYLGHSFLDSVYSVNYTIDGLDGILFVSLTAHPDSAARVLNDYLNFVSSPPDRKNEKYRIPDPYNGDVLISICGSHVIGLAGDLASGSPADLIDGLRRQLTCITRNEVEDRR